MAGYKHLAPVQMCVMSDSQATSGQPGTKSPADSSGSSGVLLGGDRDANVGGLVSSDDDMDLHEALLPLTVDLITLTGNLSRPPVSNPLLSGDFPGTITQKPRCS